MARLSASRRRRIEDGGGSRHHSFRAGGGHGLDRPLRRGPSPPTGGSPQWGWPLKSELTPRQPTRIGSTCSIDRRWLSPTAEGRLGLRYVLRGLGSPSAPKSSNGPPG